MTLYADILLPLALQQTLTFDVGEELQPVIREGQAVEVNVGLRKHYTGIVWRLHHNKPSFKTKTVLRLVRNEILVDADARRLWEWIADYYLSSLGEVMRAALPALLKPAGLTTEQFDQNRFAPRTERCLRLNPTINTVEELNRRIDAIPKRSKGQLAAIVEFCGRFADERAILTGEVARSTIKASDATLRRLTLDSLFVSVKRETTDQRVRQCTPTLPTLSPAQEQALLNIESQFGSFNTVLLDGVTGSGKTEIYMHLIASTIARGESVLYLLPEIAITKQLTERLERSFGSSVTLYHSKLTDRQRTETYLQLARSSGAELIVGVRSALLLPTHRLGLIVVDEEHDRSFKQEEPAPRYSARDTAVWIALATKAKVLLGSATPSLESYTNALQGKYGLVQLTERYGTAAMPTITLSDSRRSARRGERKLHINKELLDSMTESLQHGRQVLLFQNRRGYSPYMCCEQCGWTARCPNCNVTLTLHKADNMLHCHYCNYSTQPLSICPSCGSPITYGGLGTERVEEAVAELFPDACIARLDRDTATPARYRRILTDFEAGRIDILIGTQIITKGFDFEGIETVGVLNADNLFTIPDFRASERAFQLLTQVAGRAGRRDSGGRVIIQTTEPDNPILQMVVASNYGAMYATQSAERREVGYPPFGRLIEVKLKQSDEQLLTDAADRLAAELKRRFPNRISDPFSPAVDHVRGEAVLALLLHSGGGVAASAMKSALREAVEMLAQRPLFRKVAVAINVDPQ